MKKLILISALLFSNAASAEFEFDKHVKIFEFYASQCDRGAEYGKVPSSCLKASVYRNKIKKMYGGGYVISKSSSERAIAADDALTRAINRIKGN